MIIEADGKFYQIVGHAEAKMMLANISEVDVIEVIEEGDLEYTDQGDELYLKEVDGRNIGVVIADEERIITVMIVK